MTSIPWERDAAGSSARREKSDSKRYISPPEARNIVRKLMHEVSVISGEFNNGLVVYSRLLGISVFDQQGGTYYGLYADFNLANDPSLPTFGLRKLHWEKAYRHLDSVLNNLVSTTLFSTYEHLPHALRGLIETADRISSLRHPPVAIASEGSARARSSVGYFLLDDDGICQGEYETTASIQPTIEQKYQELAVLFEMLSQGGAVTPNAGTFRVSYTFDLMAFMNSRY